jgi:phosphoribosylformylglycinamidine synthase subunit PurL
MVESLRNLACSGAVPLAMTDNLNFGNPYKPEVFYTLKESVRGLAEACRFFDVPVVGGNVSLYNENQKGAIDPTPVVSVVGLIEKEEHITRQFCRTGKESLILIGGLPNELGGSQYLGIVHGLKTGAAPAVDLKCELAVHDFTRKQIREGRVTAAHDISEGGLLVALAEMLFGETSFGASLSLKKLPNKQRLDEVLFGESQGRIILAVEPEKVAQVLADAEEQEIDARVVGIVSSDPVLSVDIGGGKITAEWPVSELREAWETSIERQMSRPGID